MKKLLQTLKSNSINKAPLSNSYRLKVSLSMLYVLCSMLCNAQWVAQMHSDVSAKSIAMQTDDAENVYVAGVYSQVLTIFGVGRTTDANTTLTGASTTLTGVATLRFPANNNVFLCKYNKDGVLLWAKSLGQVDTAAEPIRSYLALQVDGVGNSYLFGYWNANCTMTGFDCNTKKPGLIKFNAQGDTSWVKYASPASSIFEGYLEKSLKDEELYLNFSATTAFTFGGQAFGSGGKTFAIKADGTQRVVSELPGASPMLVHPCGNVLYKYGNNLIYRDSANNVGRTVLSITGGAKILKLEVDSLGYITGIGKFKDASINVAGQTLTNSRPTLTNAWDVFAFKIKKNGEKVWVKNILSWETGTGNGYIGMAVDGGGGVDVYCTIMPIMSILGGFGSYGDIDGDAGFIVIDSKGLTGGSRFYSTTSKFDAYIYSLKSERYFSFRTNGNTLINNSNTLQLANLGNGIVTVKYKYNVAPPPPFSTKFLYCNTVTSSVPGTSTGLGEVGEIETIKIYPNPSEGSFTVALENEVMSSYVIYSIIGAIVEQGTFQKGKQVTIQAGGIYLVEIKQANRKYRQKIVIQ